MTDVPAHRQVFTNRYIVAYAEHEPRAKDPHRRDFEEWKRRQKESGHWRCHWADEIDDDSECDHEHPLEAHHSHIEFALANNVSLEHLEHLYPGISDPGQVGAWIDSDANLVLLCAYHHRSFAGIHHLDAAMWEAAKVLRPGTVTDDRP